MSNASVPEHWTKTSWEEKARENPLYAIMTVDEFTEETLDTLDSEIPASFFEKGQRIYDALVKGNLSARELAVPLKMFDYGCGIGRIMRAVIDAGHEVSGADISETMIARARDVVPEARALVTVAQNGRIDLPDGAFDIAYSFAVLQHISSLKAHQKAVSEMCRLLKPGGWLIIQVNCEDFGVLTEAGDPSYTVNFERVSVHLDPATLDPLRVHPQDNWSGVYIGREKLVDHLNENGMRVLSYSGWSKGKPRATVFVARKETGKNEVYVRDDPVASAGPKSYRTLMNYYVKEAVARARLKREANKLKQTDSHRSSQMI